VSERDTIVAVATAAGRAGIGVLRLSGPQAHAIAQSVCGRAPVVGAARHARFRDAAGELIDDGLLLAFAAPRSYTGEDVVELQGHGNPLLLAALQARCVELGARPAGMHGFQWQPTSMELPAAADGYRFRVVATQGAASVPSTPLMLDRVEAVATLGERLMLETRVSGRIEYGQVKAVGG